MKTIQELAAFMRAAAAKREDSYLPMTGLYALGHTDAAQAVAAEHGADAEDVAFVGSVLFACWNDALEWAEAAKKEEPEGEHRHFYFWCPNCMTRVHVETAERKEDDARDVYASPTDPECPMCGHAYMEDWDTIAAHDESFRNHGTWADFERWRAKEQGAKKKP